MIYRISTACVVLALAGCSAPVPDSNPNARGVGFGDYDRYASQREARDAQLEARISSEDPEARAIAQNTQDVLNQTGPAGTAAVPERLPVQVQVRVPVRARFCAPRRRREYPFW